ncbi:hypothetical protein WMY93_010461 [Mugilogobius chulae]|uniref:Uncharacterized protein n=1 Tax=Mugilogobius chulae TaxID=88201 RepID=A0AAW0P788_9GOBI
MIAVWSKPANPQNAGNGSLDHRQEQSHGHTCRGQRLSGGAEVGCSQQPAPAPAPLPAPAAPLSLRRAQDVSKRD